MVTDFKSADQKLTDTRAAFEVWVQRVRVQVDLTRKPGGGYKDRDIDWLWDAFMAGWRNKP